MTPVVTLLLGATLGVATGSLLVPVTRRELAAAVHRSTSLTTRCESHRGIGSRWAPYRDYSLSTYSTVPVGRRIPCRRCCS
jgi:hypothetical protein